MPVLIFFFLNADFRHFFRHISINKTDIIIEVLDVHLKPLLRIAIFNWAIDNKIHEKTQHILPELQLSAFFLRVFLICVCVHG